MSTLPNLKELAFGGAGAIQDPAQLDFLNSAHLPLSVMQDESLDQKFLDTYRSWIESNLSNTIKGLELFPYACYSQATTESFDKFYLKNSQRRFRCFRAEYMYHILTWRNCFPNWKRLEDGPLESNDAVVISYPFSDTGNKHPMMDSVLQQASELGVPVLVDMAYFGLCSGLEFDLSWPCITDVTFSMSKSFPVANARIGMRLTKVDDDDPLFVVNKTRYINRLGVALGLIMLEKFSSDYIPLKYRALQHQWCNELGADPSPTVIFGLGHQKWNQYDRGAGNHRLCFNRYMGTGQLPKDYF